MFVQMFNLYAPLLLYIYFIPVYRLFIFRLMRIVYVELNLFARNA